MTGRGAGHELQVNACRSLGMGALGGFWAAQSTAYWMSVEKVSKPARR
jgi:hypothetical protein